MRQLLINQSSHTFSSTTKIHPGAFQHIFHVEI